MEITLEDLKNISPEDVVKVTSLTDYTTKNYPNDCITDAVIELNDGSMMHIEVGENEREQVTSAIQQLVFDTMKSHNLGMTMENVGKVFRQCNIGEKDAEEEYDVLLDDYDDYAKSESRKNILKKVGIGTGVAVGATAAIAGGAAFLTGCGQEKEAEVDETVATEEVNSKVEIKGTSWEFYLENGVEGQQKEMEKDFYQVFETLNTRMSRHTYTNDAGVNGKLSLTVQEARMLYLILHNFSNEQIAEFMGGETFEQIPMMDSEGNPVLDENGTPLMEDATVIIHSAFATFQEWFDNYALDEEDINAVTGLFDTAHNKEIVSKFLSGHSAILNAEDEKTRKELAKDQRALYEQIFASDITDSNTKTSDEATAFLSRTMYPSDTKLANAYNYSGTELVYQSGTGESVEVKTALYGGQFDAWFRYGHMNYDFDNYLKEVGKNPNQFYVKMSDSPMSTTDSSCDAVLKKVDRANEYIRNLQNSAVEFSSEQQLALIEAKMAENGTISNEELNQIMNSVNVVSKLDELKARTYSINDIEDLIRENMKTMGKYPEHVEVFAEKWEKRQEEIKNQLNNGSYKGGSKGGSSKNTGKETFNQGTTEQNREAAKEEIIDRGYTEAQAEQLIAQAEKEENERKGILGADNQETAQKAVQEEQKRNAENQATYNEAWNYAYNWYATYGNTNGSPANESKYMNDYSLVDKHDGAFTNSVTIRDAYMDGKAAGMGAWENSIVQKAESGDKKAEEEAKKEGLISGGEQKIDPSLKDYISNVGTNGPSDKDAQDVIDEGNKEDSNKGNQGPVVTNPGVQMPAPEEENKEEQPSTPVEQPSEEQEVGGGDVVIWDEDDILSQFSASDDEIRTRAIEEVVNEMVEQEANGYSIDSSLAEVEAELESESSYTR